MILDLCDRREGDLHYLAIRDLDFDAGRGEGLGRLHAPHFTAHSLAVGRNDLHIVFSVKWLQGRECFGYLHTSILLATSNMPFQGPEVYRTRPHATGKRYLAYTKLSVYSSDYS